MPFLSLLVSEWNVLSYTHCEEHEEIRTFEMTFECFVTFFM